MVSSAPTPWVGIAQALAQIAEAVGSLHLARRFLRGALVEGRIRSRAGFISGGRSSMPKPTASEEELSKDFWRHASVDWDDLTKPIVRHLIYVAGGANNPLPYLEAYSVEIAPDFAKSLPSTARDRAHIIEQAPLGRQATAVSKPQRRGRRATRSQAVIAAMRQVPRVELEAMLEKTMQSTFGASRDTCRKARSIVLSEIVDE